MPMLMMAIRSFGGLAIFLFGLHTMSDALKRAAGDRLKTILSHLTRNRVIALLTGTLVTAAIQSSSAATVMIVGLVNAGLLTIRQGISLVLGANIGTTFTAWIVSVVGKFDIGVFALPSVSAGFVMMYFMKRRRIRNVGGILFGFGLLFFGLDIMKEAFSPLRDSDAVVELFAKFSAYPLLGVLVGAAFTVLLQSSSATITIVQLLAYQGVIPFSATIPIILGDNIGTTATAELASIGSTPAAKHAARAHTLFNIVGCCMMLPLVLTGVYERVVLALFPGELTPETVMMHMAFAHTMFNVLNAAFFTTFIGFLEKMSGMITLAKEKEAVGGPRQLDENLIDTPPLAMAHVVGELVRMMEYAKDTVEKAAQGFISGDKALLDQAQEQEQVIDEFQRGIVAYLIKISELNLDSRESMEYPILLHSANDVEKIGDYAVNIVKYGEHRISHQVGLTEDAVERIQGMFAVLYQLFDKTIDALRLDSDGRARDAVVLEDRIDGIKRSVRAAFVDNLQRGQGSPVVEIYVMDIATTIEKMGDHLISIAKAVLKDLQWDQRVMVSEKLELSMRGNGDAAAAEAGPAGR